MALRITFTLSLFVAAIALAPLTVSAQISTSTGTFGARTLGGGVQGLGQPGAGGAGFGAGSTTQAQSAGQVTGNERFIEANRQPGAFVGADSTDATNARSNVGLGQTQFGNQFGGALGRAAQQLANPNGGNNSNNNARQIRAPLQVGFRAVPLSPRAVSTTIQTRFGRLPGLQDELRGSAGIAVSMTGRTAVLRGTVGSEHARELAARLAMLEPGVSSVKNELVVAQPSAGLEELPRP